MARIYTYSFEDTSLTISHPAVGSFDAYGTGIGDISIFNKIIAYPVSELPTYKADFTALYEKGMAKEDKAEVHDIEDILNLKTVLAKPELSSVYEKTMLDYNLMRETLKSKMKI